MILGRSNSSKTMDTPASGNRKITLIRSDSWKTIDTSNTGETSSTIDTSTTTGGSASKLSEVVEEIDRKERETDEDVFEKKTKIEWSPINQSKKISYQDTHKCKSNSIASSNDAFTSLAVGLPSSVDIKRKKRPRRVKPGSYTNRNDESRFLVNSSGHGRVRNRTPTKDQTYSKDTTISFGTTEKRNPKQTHTNEVLLEIPFDEPRSDKGNFEQNDEQFPKEDLLELRFERFLRDFYQELSNLDHQLSNETHVEVCASKKSLDITTEINAFLREKCKVLAMDDFLNSNELFPQEDFIETVNLFSVGSFKERRWSSVDSLTAASALNKSNRVSNEINTAQQQKCKVLAMADFSSSNALFPKEDFIETADLFSVDSVKENTSSSPIDHSLLTTHASKKSLNSNIEHQRTVLAMNDCSSSNELFNPFKENIKIPVDSFHDEGLLKIEELRKKRDKLRQFCKILPVDDSPNRNETSLEGEVSKPTDNKDNDSRLDELRRKREKLRQLKRKIEITYSSHTRVKDNGMPSEQDMKDNAKTYEGKNSLTSKPTNSSNMVSKLKIWSGMRGTKQQQKRTQGKL